jgi:hypothetical protein
MPETDAAIAHQHEQRNDGEFVDRGIAVRVAAEHVQRGRYSVQDGKADGADQQHGDADRHAQRQQDEHDHHAQQAGHLGGNHDVCPGDGSPRRANTP